MRGQIPNQAQVVFVAVLHWLPGTLTLTLTLIRNF